MIVSLTWLLTIIKATLFEGQLNILNGILAGVYAEEGKDNSATLLKALEMNISKYIQNGQAVKLGYLGSFIPAIKAKSQESADDVNADTIKRFWCRFFPSTDFKRELGKCKFSLTDLNVKGMIK